MSIATKLQKILDSKAAIKAAIAGKGGTITDATPLDEYAQAIDNLPSGGDLDEFITAYFNQVIEQLVLPTGVLKLADSALREQTALRECVIPNSVTSIGANCFWNCVSLTSIIIPNSVTSIGVSCFHNARNLASLEFEQGSTLTSTPTNFTVGCIFPRIIFPSSIQTFAINCLAQNAQLIYIELGENVTNIGNSFANYAKTNCTVIIKTVAPPTLGTNFLRNNFAGKIYVPDASVNDYKTATNWSTWASYIYPLSDYQP